MAKISISKKALELKFKWRRPMQYSALLGFPVFWNLENWTMNNIQKSNNSVLYTIIRTLQNSYNKMVQPGTWRHQKEEKDRKRRGNRRKWWGHPTIMTQYFKLTLQCNLKQYHGGCEVLTAVVMRSSIFWDITLCSKLKINWCFGGTCRLHLQGSRISKQETSMKQVGLFGFLLSLLQSAMASYESQHSINSDV
jgi:hypothetical protein